MEEIITKRKLSLGITILAIVLFIFASDSLSRYFRGTAEIIQLFWGSLYVAGGIGLLMRKVWGYRITQAIFVIAVIFTPLILFLEDIDFIVRLIVVAVLEGIFVLILKYLSKKEVKEQFFEAPEEQSSEGKNLKSGFGVIFSFLGFIIYVIFGIWSLIINLSLVSEMFGFFRSLY